MLSGKVVATLVISLYASSLFSMSTPSSPRLYPQKPSIEPFRSPSPPTLSPQKCTEHPVCKKSNRPAKPPLLDELIMATPPPQTKTTTDKETLKIIIKNKSNSSLTLQEEHGQSHLQKGKPPLFPYKYHYGLKDTTIYLARDLAKKGQRNLVRLWFLHPAVSPFSISSSVLKKASAITVTLDEFNSYEVDVTPLT